MKTHYPEVNVGRVAARFPKMHRDGTIIDQIKVLESVSEEASKVAKSVILVSYFPETPCPRTPEPSDTEHSEEDEETNDATKRVPERTIR